VRILFLSSISIENLQNRYQLSDYGDQALLKREPIFSQFWLDSLCRASKRCFIAKPADLFGANPASLLANPRGRRWNAKAGITEVEYAKNSIYRDCRGAAQ
jgi:hypothetical protein